MLRKINFVSQIKILFINSPEYVAALTTVAARFGREYICVLVRMKQFLLRHDTVRYHRLEVFSLETLQYS